MWRPRCAGRIDPTSSAGDGRAERPTRGWVPEEGGRRVGAQRCVGGGAACAGSLHEVLPFPGDHPAWPASRESGRRDCRAAPHAQDGCGRWACCRARQEVDRSVTRMTAPPWPSHRSVTQASTALPVRADAPPSRLPSQPPAQRPTLVEAPARRPVPCAARPSTSFRHLDGPCRCFFGGPAPEFGAL